MNISKTLPRRFRTKRLFGAVDSRRGLTLAEVSIMMLMSLLISMVVVGLMYESALAIKDMYAETRTRSTRMIALDQVRYRLSGAAIDTISITNANHSIEFANPNLGWGTVSRFDFVPATRRLFYDNNVDDTVEPIEVAQGPIDLTFELDIQSSGGLVRLNVRSAADVAFGDVDEQDGETAIFLRNT